ncbi:protein of unknown function [Cupriavidus taiwanensis]|nr:protein of unknown function [Cupriavidus taiwanensis]
MLILDSSSINRQPCMSRPNPALQQRGSQPPATSMAKKQRWLPTATINTKETIVTGPNAAARPPQRRAMPEDRVRLSHAGAGQGGRP